MVYNSQRRGSYAAESFDTELEAYQNLESIVEVNQETKDRWDSLFAFTRKTDLIWLSVAIFFSMISGLVIPAMSIVLGSIFDTFTKFGHGDLNNQNLASEVWRDVARLLLLGMVGWVSNGVFFTCWLYFGERQAHSARKSLFRGLLEKEISWYDTLRHGGGSLVSGCQTRIKELQNAVSQPLGYCIQAVITSTACIGIALFHCWDLTFIILAGFPIAAFILNRLSSKIPQQVCKQKNHLAESSKIVERIMASIDTVKAFNAELIEKGLFTKAITHAGVAYRSQARNYSMQIGLIQFITFAMFVQGFWYGNVLVNEQERATAGDVMTTFWSCLMATQSLQLILPQLAAIEKGAIAAETLRVLLRNIKQAGRRKNSSVGNLNPPCPIGEIKLHDVSFTYPSRPDQLALKNLTLCIPANKTTWIVGRSGSGKSTLGNLLLRAYEPSCGLITIGGIPLRQIDTSWLRDNISIVQQHSVLFDDTVFRNVAIGRKSYENVRIKDMEEAVRTSSLNEVIERLPFQYETNVGIAGCKLSGGQRQRVSLARSMLRDSICLILDEAVAALDSSSRKLIIENIRNCRKGKTTIIITHDLSQIPAEDLVYVLDGGELVVGGPRQELEELGELMLFLPTSGESAMGPITEMLEPEYISPPPYEATSTSAKVPCRTPYGNGLANRKPRLALDLTISTEAEGLEEQSVTPIHKRPTLRRTRYNICGYLCCNRLVHNFTRCCKVISNIGKETHQTGSLLSVLKSIWPTLNGLSKMYVCVGALAAFIHAIATPVFSYALANLLSTFFHGGSGESQVMKWSLVVLGIAVIDGICSYSMHYLLESAGQVWIDRLRVTAVRRILKQPKRWFDKNRSITSRIMEDLEKNAEEMRNLVGRFAGYGFVSTVMLVSGITWSFIECWQLTLVGVCVLPAMYGITRGFSWISDHLEEQCNEAAASCGQVLMEAIGNIWTVKILSLDRYFWSKYNRVTKQALGKGFKRSITAGICFGLADSAILFALAVIFYGGSVFLTVGQYKLDSIFMVFTLLSFSLANTNVMVGMIPQISCSKETALRVLRLVNLDVRTHETKGRDRIDITGQINFYDVSFRYVKNSRFVLQNINFSARPGECVAIVGASGSGKSTLLSLLQKLYRPSSGFIIVDGRDLSHIHTTHYRSQISIVPQQPVIFDATIANNIAYGEFRPHFEVTQQTIEEAAKMAGIDGFINSLPLQYETHIQPGSLSGGQAQRLSLARALVRKPKVLILDEMTSGLDEESGRATRDTIRQLVEKEEICVIMVTHSEEMVKGAANRVLVLKDGRVVQEGRYRELMELGKGTDVGNWGGSGSRRSSNPEKSGNMGEDLLVGNELRRIFGK